MIYQVFTNKIVDTWYRDEYFDFLKDGYYNYYSSQIIEKDGIFISEQKDVSDFNDFCHWKNIEVKRKFDFLKDKYISLKITYCYYDKNYYTPFYHKNNLEFFISKEESYKIIDFYNQRNRDMLEDKKEVMSNITKIDTNIFNMAENLLNIVEENIMLNYCIVSICHNEYSYIVNEEEYKSINEMYPIIKDTSLLKGKTKKEIDNYNTELVNKFINFKKIIDNFVEIIIDQKKVNVYVARAIAWDAIQKKTIEYYTNKWINEYDLNFEKSFNDIYTDYQNQDINMIAREYIKSIILHNEVDIDNIAEILMYFLLSKKNIRELILYNQFVDFYELIKEIKKELESLDIKQKLRIKKSRKIIKYTIDDIDLMTGLEFEKFVELLFRKMGYSTQLTKQSGDQGLDVIVIKNGNKIGIQVKCYSNTVGNSAIQEAFAGKSFYDCDKVLVITNNYFTTSAVELAQANDVILWNRDILKEKLKELL